MRWRWTAIYVDVIIKACLIFHFHVLQFIICIQLHDMKMQRSEMSPPWFYERGQNNVIRQSHPLNQHNVNLIDYSTGHESSSAFVFWLSISMWYIMTCSSSLVVMKLDERATGPWYQLTLLPVLKIIMLDTLIIKLRFILVAILVIHTSDGEDPVGTYVKPIWKILTITSSWVSKDPRTQYEG